MRRDVEIGDLLLQALHVTAQRCQLVTDVEVLGLDGNARSHTLFWHWRQTVNRQ